MLGPQCSSFYCMLQSTVTNIHAAHTTHVSQSSEQIWQHTVISARVGIEFLNYIWMNLRLHSRYFLQFWANTELKQVVNPSVRGNIHWEQILFWRTFYPLNPLNHNGYCTYNLLKTEPHHLPIDIIASAFRTIIRSVRTNRVVSVMEYSVFCEE